LIDIYSQYNRLLPELSKGDVEPLLADYQENLIKLNRIVESTGEKIEGSLFNAHEVTELGDVPFPPFRSKRINFIKYVCTGRTLLEVGFNAGHSALLALSVNKYLRYTGIDIGKYRYTHLSYEYLKSVFGDRIDMHFGDSRELMPPLRSGAYDLIHIDGGHGAGVSHADLTSAIKIAKPNSVILFDDAAADYMATVIHYYIMTGHLAETDVMGSWSRDYPQVLLRVNKPL